MAGANRQNHDCPQCHVPQARFYCQDCLLDRIQAHHKQATRLSEASQAARNLATSLFGISRQHAALPHEPPSSPVALVATKIPDAAAAATFSYECGQHQAHPSLPDPFEQVQDNDSDPSSHPMLATNLHIRCIIYLRARRDELASSLEELRSTTSDSRTSSESTRQTIQRKRFDLRKRHQNLVKAWSQFGGSYGTEHASRVASQSLSPDRRASQPSAQAKRWSPVRGPGAWLVDERVRGQAAFQPNDWSTDVYPSWDHGSLYLDAPSSTTPHPGPSTDSLPSDERRGAHGLGSLIEQARADLLSLEKQSRETSEELQRTRAILAKEAFAIFDVRPPSGLEISNVRVTTSHRKDSSAPVKAIRLSERFMPGAFAFAPEPDSPSDVNRRTSSAHSRESSAPLNSELTHPGPASGGTANPNDWSIAGLVLPLPSDIRRFPRDSINGAIAHTIHLLQLLTSYLGITLPFAIGVQGGKINIRPHSLWDGGGGSTKQALHLSSAAYSVLSTPSANSSPVMSRFGLAESTLGLGASTLSTLESFIHLPPRSHLSWGLASALSGGAKSPEDDKSSKTGSTDTGDRERAEKADQESSSRATRSKSDKNDPAAQAANAFCSALVMLTYDIAYLAHTQGVKADLVTAAGSCLRLLQQTIANADLGKRAHNNYGKEGEIKDLDWQALDYHQLVQILEPMKADGTSQKRKDEVYTAKASKASRPIMEQSYVDAREAAASVLDIKDPSQRTVSDRGVKTSKSSKGTERRDSREKVQPSKETVSDSRFKSSSSRAPATTEAGGLKAGNSTCGRSRVHPAAQQPTSLDFLRKRGLDAEQKRREASSIPKDRSKSSSTGQASSKETHTSDRSNSTRREKQASEAAPGAVIFNGVEIGSGSADVRDKRHKAPQSSKAMRGDERRSGRSKGADAEGDDGWDLV